MKRGTAVVMERNALPMAEERQRALEADWKRIDAARARREKLAAVSADALGRDRVGSIVKDLPRPFPPPAKGSIFTDVRKAIETQGALQYYFAEMRGHNLSIITAPFDAMPPITSHGGNNPDEQYAMADPSGELVIVSMIENDSSNIYSQAQLQIRIAPMFPGNGPLSVRYYVQWADWHYLDAYAGGSHSDGKIGSELWSTRPDGSDLRFEVASPGQKVWDADASGIDTGQGHSFSDGGPDDEGVAWPPYLQLDIPHIDSGRIYFARLFIESHSDADGTHGLYASRASVTFYAFVKWITVEQSGPWWTP